MLKRFLLRMLLFMGLNALLLLLLLHMGNMRLRQFAFNCGNTESNLLHIADNESYDIVILGASHARSLSRKGNHQRIEQILGKKIANLSKGHGAGGIKNQYLYLTYFLKKGNTARLLVYFIDPFVFYNDKMDNHNFIYNDEPFRFDFALHIIRHGISAETFVNYLKYKLKPYHYWWNYQPDLDSAETDYLTRIDSIKIQQRLAVLYPDGMPEKIYRSKMVYLKKIIALARKNNMQLIFIIPPTLIGKLPGHDTMLNELSRITPALKIIDYSASIMQPVYYYDHDHLNTAGVVLFTQNYLRHVLY